MLPSHFNVFLKGCFNTLHICSITSVKRMSDVQEIFRLLFVLAVKPNFHTLIPKAYPWEQFITLKLEFVKNISF